MNTCASGTSACSFPRSASVFRSSATERLLRLSAMKMEPISGFFAALATLRWRSPSGASILITSAPRSPRTCVAYGPKMKLVRSRMRMPSSGPLGMAHPKGIASAARLRHGWQPANHTSVRTMQLHLSSWPEIGEYLKTSKAILIPIGSTEQHGPNGLLGTDALCPEIIAKRAGDEAGILIGPTFNVGQAQHHMAFSGTITLRPSTMIAAMMDWAQSLTRHG